MNKDLEIIKNEVKNFGEQSIQTSLDIIVTTAERMADKIVYLEELDKCNFKNAKELIKENEALKAELEKRPEVVRCGECKRKDTVNCSTSKYEGIEGVDGHWQTQTTDDFYCGIAVRRESEEGK